MYCISMGLFKSYSKIILPILLVLLFKLFSQLGQEEVREFLDQLLIYKELEYIDDNICQILYLY